MLTLKEIDKDGPELESFRDLLREYQAFLGVDLCFQKFESEIANPLDKYTPPRGIVSLGYWSESPPLPCKGRGAGGEGSTLIENENILCACGALQDLGDNVCEIKRIYVKPEFRRKGIARTISEYLLQRAREIGYEKAKLDTLRRLTGAVPLYQSLGFVETAPYNFNPEADIVYMERALDTKIIGR